MRRTNLIMLAAALVLSPCAHAAWFGSKTEDLDKKRATIREERDQMLNELYANDPSTRALIANSVGYATFKQLNVNLLLVASTRGTGSLVETKGGRETFMRMASLGGGVGAGLKDLRVIFVFTDAKVMKQFVEEGWQFGGQADAAAKHGDTGASAEGNVKGNVSFEEGTVAVGGSADTRAGVESKGQAGGAAVTPGGMQVYQFTESGLSFQATVSGTKYWKDSDLNK